MNKKYFKQLIISISTFSHLLSTRLLLLVISHLSLVILICGCAKTVTQLPNVGNQLNIEIVMRGDMDSSKYSYYILFGSSSPVIPYIDKYFFAPGENYDQDKMDIEKKLDYYYKTYFSTWSDFIVLKDNTFYITNGAFPSFEAHSNFSRQFLAVNSSKSKINLVLYFSRLSAVSQDLYFNFICVDDKGYIKDFLRSSDNKISVNQGSRIFSSVEPQDAALAPALDIISWDLVVQ